TPNLNGRSTEVVAQVAHQVGVDDALDEVPDAVGAGEAVVVATGQDRLQREARPGLEDGEVAARRRRPAVGRDVDGEVRDDVLGAGDAVVQDDAVVRPADLGRARQRLGPVARAPRGPGEQVGHAVEVARV